MPPPPQRPNTGKLGPLDLSQRLVKVPSEPVSCLDIAGGVSPPGSFLWSFSVQGVSVYNCLLIAVIYAWKRYQNSVETPGHGCDFNKASRSISLRANIGPSRQPLYAKPTPLLWYPYNRQGEGMGGD